MQSADVLNKLWAGIIYKQELDLLLQRAAFYIKTQDDNIYRYYELVFDEILNFNIKNEETSPWVQAELTELYYSKDQNNNYKFDIIIWSETHMIEITCKNWKLNLLKEFDESD